jgi:late competence protein required for DNA uptake (superfamily II DNA/RNA helicase)
VEYLFEFAATPDQQQLAKDLYENLRQGGSTVLQKIMGGGKSMVIRNVMCNAITQGLGMMPMFQGPPALHEQNVKLTSMWYEQKFGKCGIVLWFSCNTEVCSERHMIFLATHIYHTIKHG